MSNETKQTAVEWLESRITTLIPNDIGSQLMYKNNIKKAKEMEKEHIAEAFTKGNRLDFYDATETIGEKYSKELCGCQFEMDTSTSSATKCKFCGKEKWQHISGRI